ncbi:MAG: GAF domain-containing sensor histidine kinase [Actinobacteria bacterium]|nr:GAF domain-containing sensor histidine kinase [Actinomycetota bacterium]
MEWVLADPDGAERLRSLLAEEGPVGMGSGEGGRADGGFVAPLGSKEPFAGLLGAVPVPDRPLSHADEDLLRAVAGQIGVALDNARLHRDERDRLRSYVQEVTRAQEEERKRLARELHDTVAQDLVRLVRGLDGMTEAPAARSDEMTAGDLRGLGGAILEDVRRVGRDLRPTVLDDLGLVAGLEWLSSDLRVRSGIEATFRVSGRRRRLPGEVELVLFRIAQEALTNVEKHAGAGTVAVLARFEAGSVRLVVEDDGRGFEPARSHRLAREGRFGLVGMEERARLVGGSIDVRSRPGGGTAVSVEVPLGRGPQLPEQVPEL